MDVAKENVDVVRKLGVSAEVAGVYTPVMDTYKLFFDGVFLNAVLEHLLFPKAAIHNMREYLKLYGKMVILVPDMKLVGEGNSHPSHHFHHEHINYFSIMSLDRLMQNEGFSRIYYKDIVEDGDLERLMVAVYEKSNKMQDENIVDTISATAIEEYLKTQKHKNIKTRKILQEIKEQKIVLWGIGARMMQTIADAGIYDLNITRLVDGNSARWNSRISFNGTEYVIESPASIANKLDDDSVIVVCCNSKQYEDEIRNMILKKGMKNRLVFL